MHAGKSAITQVVNLIARGPPRPLAAPGNKARYTTERASSLPPCAKRSTKLSIQSSFHKLGRSSSVGHRIIQSALRE